MNPFMMRKFLTVPVVVRGSKVKDIVMGEFPPPAGEDDGAFVIWSLTK